MHDSPVLAHGMKLNLLRSSGAFARIAAAVTAWAWVGCRRAHERKVAGAEEGLPTAGVAQGQRQPLKEAELTDGGTDALRPQAKH